MVFDTYTQYKLVSDQYDRFLKTERSDPINVRRSQNYLKEVSKAKTIDEFIDNPRLYNYAMEAFGLEEMTFARGLMRKILQEGLQNRVDVEGKTVRLTLANRLRDPRYLEFARAFDFAQYGPATTARPETGQAVVDKFHNYQVEVGQGEENEAVRLALYFKRRAPTIKNGYELLNDDALREVARTLARLPKEIFANYADSVDRIADIFDKRVLTSDGGDPPRLDIKDPEKLEKMMRRFAVLWDLDNGSPAPATAVPNIQLGAGVPIIGIPENTLLALQNLNFGG